MSGKKRVLLTLEERLKLAAGSQAASPETAVKLVQRFSQLHAAMLFGVKPDLETMNELIGEFWDCPEVDVDSYRGFCPSFQLALSRDNNLFLESAPATEIDPYRPLWGARVNNALVLLGLILLDHTKGRLKCKDIYHCTQMTLEQYLDATDGFSILTDLHRRQIWKDVLLQNCDGSGALGDALERILERYMDGWQVFDHLDHILRCMGGLACYLEQEGEGERVRDFRKALCQYAPDLEGRELADADVRYIDPNGYFFALANEYPGELPDLGGDIPPGAVRRQIFLPARDYSPDALQALAALSPSPELQELLEENITGDRLVSAMLEINWAVNHLYLLWVEPYLSMEEDCGSESGGQGARAGRD